jgi:hypothetical protein
MNVARGLATRRTLVLAVAVMLLAAGCGGGKKAAKGRAAATTLATTTTTLPPVAPLTGLPLADAAKRSRPALVIKVENAPEARPQSGLDAADVVYEEIVEGGITRFLAVFHSADADPVGPVRSVRPSDPDIMSPFGGLFGYSGGTQKFINLLDNTPGITDVGVDKQPGAYNRRSGKAAPHNLYTSTPALYAKAPAGSKAPPRFADFLPEGQPFAAAGAAPATNLTATVGSTSVVFDYDAATSTYKRTGLNEGAATVAPSNVIVQFTGYQISPGDFDPSGAPVSVASTIGTGDAIILSGGMAVRGKWTKASQTALTTYTDASGAPVKLTPGRTWIELPANGSPAATR